MPLPPLVDPAPPLTGSGRERYSRHLLLGELGELGQRRLAAARVLVVGAGGLGSPAALYLAAAGVGRLSIVDDDTVAASNLQRQILHGEAAVGTPKVESAAHRLRGLNSGVEIDSVPERVSEQNVDALVAGHDLVIDGTDNFATRYLLNDACVRAGVPEVWASILRFDGQLSVFWAGRGPCYRCLFPSPPAPGSVPSCAEGGVLGALCGVLGSAQAIEAVKLIAGFGEPLVGRVAVFNALSARWGELAVRSDPGCPACGDVRSAPAGSGAGEPAPAEPAAVPEITPGRLATRLAARHRGEDDFVLLDVRTAAERQINAIAGAEHRELSAVTADDPGPGLRGRDVVVHCKSGARSATATAHLIGRGIRAINLTGGIDAWIDEVEPEQARY